MKSLGDLTLCLPFDHVHEDVVFPGRYDHTAVYWSWGFGQWWRLVMLDGERALSGRDEGLGASERGRSVSHRRRKDLAKSVLNPSDSWHNTSNTAIALRGKAFDGAAMMFNKMKKKDCFCGSISQDTNMYLKRCVVVLTHPLFEQNTLLCL